MMMMMMTTTSRTQSGGLPTTTTSHGPTTTTARSTTTGRFEFDDGGTYCGGSDSGRAHGFGVCTGPGMQGEYAGAWQSGFETSGVYTWPNGSEYCGQWMQGKRHGLGVERRGRWVYKGEWTQGSMGRYGVRLCTTDTVSKYEGTWTSGLQDGYGLETYSDTGTYQGQWMKGQRHGYGVRKSAVNRDAAPCRTHINALHTSSLTSIRSLIIEADQSSSPSPGLGRSNSTELRHQQSLSTADRKLGTTPTARIGFYLAGHCIDSSDVTPRRSSLIGHQSAASTHRGSLSGGELRRQRSASDINSDTAAGKQRDSVPTDPSAVEIYSGEWKNDKRSGYGVCERSDGLKYEGEWLENCKCGYGVTTFGGGTDVPGGWREEGKYKNNVLLSPGKKLFLPLRSSKVRERIDSAVASALRAAQLATQKSDIANSRMESARSKAELADQVSAKAQADADRSRIVAKDVELRERQGEFSQIIEPSRERAQYRQPLNAETMVTHTSLLHSNHHPAQKQQQQQQRGYNELNKPAMEESMVDVGNDRIIFRDNSIVRRQHPVTSSMRPSPSQSRSSLSQVTTDYAHMNHVDPGGHRSPIDHVTPASSVPRINNNMTDSTSSMSHGSDIAAGGEPDRTLHWSEDTDSNKGHDLSTEGHDPAKVGVQTRPSLRYRRDFHCPNLVIFNKTPSRVDLSTACGPTGRSDAVKHTGNNTSRPVHRRLTMPSIIKYTSPSTQQPPAPTFTATTMPHVSTKTETYIVENCARKRLEEEDEMVDGVEMARGTRGSNKQVNSATASVVAAAKGATAAAANLPVLPVLEMTSLDGLDPPKPITKRYRVVPGRLGRCSGRSDLGSLPDISVVRQLQDLTPISRHEALILSQQKRDEQQQIYEQQQQQQRRRAIVLRLGDLKAWCDRRQLVLFVSAVNAALFVAFYRLLLATD